MTPSHLGCVFTRPFTFTHSDMETFMIAPHCIQRFKTPALVASGLIAIGLIGALIASALSSPPPYSIGAWTGHSTAMVTGHCDDLFIYRDYGACPHYVSGAGFQMCTIREQITLTKAPDGATITVLTSEVIISNGDYTLWRGPSGIV